MSIFDSVKFLQFLRIIPPKYDSHMMPITNLAIQIEKASNHRIGGFSRCLSLWRQFDQVIFTVL